MRVRNNPLVLKCDLGPRVAAVTVDVNGVPVAVVNTQIETDPEARREARAALAAAGFNQQSIREVLDGVRH